MRIVTALSVLVVLAAVPLAAAEIITVQTPSPRPALPPEQRRPLGQLMALFIITLLLLLVMVVAMIVLLVVMRRRLRALERERPPLPTELEDLWWQMGLPEDREKKKGT